MSENTSTWIDKESDLYNSIKERTKEHEGSASSSNIGDPVSLAGLGENWKATVKKTKLQGASSHGAYFDSRGFLTTGYGSLVSQNKPGSSQHKQDIIKWINKHLDVEVDNSTSLTSLYTHINNFNEEQASSLLDSDLDSHIEEARSLAKHKLSTSSFNDLSDNEKKVIVDMTFNLGKNKYSKFTEHWKALDERNLEKAIHEIKYTGSNQSTYYQQVGSRADKNIELLQEASQFIPLADTPSNAPEGLTKDVAPQEMVPPPPPPPPGFSTRATGNSLIDGMRQQMSTPVAQNTQEPVEQRMSQPVQKPNQLNDANSILGSIRGSIQPQVTQNKTMEIPKAQPKQASNPSLEGNSMVQNFQDVYKQTLDDHIKRVSLWQMKLGEGKIV